MVRRDSNITRAQNQLKDFARRRNYRVLTMLYNTQRYWVFGRWTKSENPISLFARRVSITRRKV
jgi:hypothetical protein